MTVGFDEHAIVEMFGEFSEPAVRAYFAGKRVKLTKREAELEFREVVMPMLHDRARGYGLKRADPTMIRCAWNDWTDGLCKQGRITTKQYASWSNPW